MNQPAVRTVLAVAICAALGYLPFDAGARDRGVNQPGAAGNPRADPGFNQPGAVGNVGVGAPGAGARDRASTTSASIVRSRKPRSCAILPDDY